jgi:hypothetical protein
MPISKRNQTDQTPFLPQLNNKSQINTITNEKDRLTDKDYKRPSKHKIVP